MLDSVDAEVPAARLGEVLRQLRMDAGVSGARLGQAVHISQSKVSKIENGRVPITSADVARIARALHASPEQTKYLVGLASRASRSFHSMRATVAAGITSAQRQLVGLEQTAHTMRYFLPAGIPGLLQTPAYARACLEVEDRSGTKIDDMVTAKQQRQQILYDQTKKFTFLFTTSALTWPILEPGSMTEQKVHLISRAELPNVDIKVVHPSRAAAMVPLHGFVIYDEHLVTIEMFTGQLAHNDPRDIAEYITLFRQYEEGASDIRDTNVFQ